MVDLPISVHDAIRRAVGRSKDQARKAEYDAHVLYERYHLLPDKWNSLAFHRMALDNGWASATENHRWGILKRVIEALHVAIGPVPIVDDSEAERQCIHADETDISHGATTCSRSDPAGVIAEPPATASSLAVTMVFSWEQVLSTPGQCFEFPGETTRFMRNEYQGPAIYRWVAFEREVGDRKEVYIGEAENLCRRIAGYLQPGPSQPTNLRLHARFQSMREEDVHVTIQRLQVQSLSLGEFSVSPADLYDKHTRVFIEHMLVTYYSKSGLTIMNA